MPKAIVVLEIRTEPQYGGDGKPIKMFEKTFEFYMTTKDWMSYEQHGYIDSRDDMPLIVPVTMEQLGVESIRFFSFINADRGIDNLEEYRAKVRDGWAPNAEQASEIRKRGYQNFFPENF